ncbi:MULTISPECIES: DUF4198 domain-containing protein [unclassified Ensifer]|uniref:DUF4198 domain-containing protein n=1 Tax=unclassified Ensifer TaxID=2633371 RepID=UPI00081335B7|nr:MULTISPECIES: DUF4198 domain-containing protein [unclassified Ensifer]OCP07168.1 hypothetical protein BBX50_22640 [Ensifer sp. LC11]OCP07750.1 hypothetical protein BC374_22855 [Ensifer sp. LC13]OCP12088.1 hypothetical protein BC362_06425 [Ensifer sp. LC14]OCP31798.1 hypothetical protein BC364_21845 [Ensifer sp. LC499]
MNTFVSPLLAAGLLIAAATPASSHGAWIAERWGTLAVVYGHGPADEAYDPAKVKSVSALGEDGKAIPVTVEPAKDHAVLKLDSEPALVALEFDNGYWSEGADGKWVNQPKNEVPGAKQASHSIKYSIALVHAHGDLPAFPAQPLQIVPLDNPIGLKPGEKFRVRLLLDGKPLEGKEITLDYAGLPDLVSEKTDANGEAEVTLRNAGVNILAVSHAIPLDGNEAADKKGLTATLTFVAEPHVHE